MFVMRIESTHVTECCSAIIFMYICTCIYLMYKVVELRIMVMVIYTCVFWNAGIHTIQFIAIASIHTDNKVNLVPS